jgi:hypothetical protein
VVIVVISRRDCRKILVPLSRLASKPNRISAGQKDGCSAHGEGWVPSSHACRRDLLLAEDAGFLFFRIFKVSGIFLGRELRQTPSKPPATWHQLGTKTQRWSGCFPKWRGAKSNGITMG